jgi:glycerol-3-phosphate dehydrogenase (NAD(P)+)
MPDRAFAVMTGPTFASEIARGLPAAVTLAAQDKNLAATLQHDLSTKTFRAYASDDVIGAQIGAALKNVIAIACGIVHGRGLGESARAAIIARGLAEMGRLCAAIGGRRETLMGLCGVGDLTLTCSSMQSRNFSLGAAMGQGQSADEILGPRKAVTEGVFTAVSALDLAARHHVDLPITRAVNDCINNGLSVDKAIQALLNRPVKEEISP